MGGFERGSVRRESLEIVQHVDRLVDTLKEDMGLIGWIVMD